jgi:hypothetical protein
MTIIFFVACRAKMKNKEEVKEEDKNSIDHINGQVVGQKLKNET